MLISPLFSDERYIKIMYRVRMGKRLDLNNCQTMNEKLQWLKLNNRHSLLTTCVDKIKVKEYLSNHIEKRYIIQTLKVWDSPKEITQEDFDKLPSSFVLKTNDGGGNTGVIIIEDKNKINLDFIKKKLKHAMKESLYRDFREWAYKNIKKQVFAETMIANSPIDYKFYCFNGIVDSVMLCVDRQNNPHPKFYFFDKNWNLKKYNQSGLTAPEGFTLPKPEGMDEMFELASELSKGIPFVRVDLYNINGNIYFGELTFTPAGGYDWNRLPETDVYFGSLIDLSLAKNEN